MQHISDNKVVQSPFFDLLEGTRAVEVTNEKLDTGLIPLTADEINFDTEKPQSIENVIGILNNLLILYMSWLNNSSLPVTVLSCRYVQTFMENYMKNGGNLKLTTFKIERLESEINRDDKSNDEFNDKLINLVLRSFILGLCKFIGFTIITGQSVLYEEEDLTTRSMDFDFLSMVSLDEILIEIDYSINWILKQKEQKELSIIIDYLQFIKFLTQLQTFVLIPINIFNETNPILLKNYTDLIDEATIITSRIYKQVKDTEYLTPSGSFSKFIQVDSSNRSIPSELYSIGRDATYKNYENFFQDVKFFIIKLSKIKNLNQFENFLIFDISHKISENQNVLTRGLFQLFLIRDDKSIVGSTLGETITSLTLRFLNNSTCLNSNILQQNSWNDIQGNQEQITEIQENVMSQLNQLLVDLETATYHNITTLANNRCRQRQLMTRSILIWDTLQVNLESVELNLWKNYKIGDRLYNPDAEVINGDEDDNIALPITSYVFYVKLLLMIEVSLSGFELDLYKPFEVGQMYWYISYLSQLTIEHITTRINKINESKIHNITNVIPKKLKKLKAGNKKQILKQQQQHNLINVIPSLEKSGKYNNDYLVPSYKALNLLSDGIRMKFIVLEGLRLIRTNNKQLTSDESLYYLRMKPWSSVGVPTLPTYEQYKNSILTSFLDGKSSSERLTKIKGILQIIINKISQAKEIYSKLIKSIEVDEILKSQIIIADDSINSIDDEGESVILWYKSLVKTCVWYNLNINNLIKLISNEEFDSQNYRVELENGYHRYFPKVLINDKTAS